MNDIVLDPKTTALVLIDLQQGIMGRTLAPHPSDQVVNKAVLLANALRAKAGTIIFVRVEMSDILDLPTDAPSLRGTTAPPPQASELVPELGVQPEDLIVTKRQWGAFYGTGLDQQLRRRSIRSILLGGVATNFGVESTARAAFDRGYQLVFAEDAMASLSVEAHNFAIKNLFPRMGRVRSVDQIMAALQ